MLLMVVVGIIFINLIADDGTPRQRVSSAVAAFLFYACIWLIYAFVLNSFAFRWMSSKSRNSGVLGEHILTLTEESLEERTSVNRSTHFWKGMFAVEENDRYIYFYLTPLQALIIPKRTFTSESDVGPFVEYARIQWRRSHT